MEGGERICTINVYTFGGPAENINGGGGGIRTGRISSNFYAQALVVVIVRLSHITPPQNFFKLEG